MFLVFFFSSFPARKCFVLFEVTLTLTFFNSLTRLFFFTKSAYANLAFNFSVVSLLNSGVVIYLP